MLNSFRYCKQIEILCSRLFVEPWDPEKVFKDQIDSSQQGSLLHSSNRRPGRNSKAFLVVVRLLDDIKQRTHTKGCGLSRTSEPQSANKIRFQAPEWQSDFNFALDAVTRLEVPSPLFSMLGYCRFVVQECICTYPAVTSISGGESGTSATGGFNLTIFWRWTKHNQTIPAGCLPLFTKLPKPPATSWCVTSGHPNLLSRTMSSSSQPWPETETLSGMSMSRAASDHDSPLKQSWCFQISLIQLELWILYVYI